MSDSDAIGYGKPPIHTRFQKGRSGNPKGRPKGVKNMATIFDQVTSEKIRVTEGRTTRTITKFEALVRQLVAKGLGGDMRAIREVFAVKRFVETMPDSAIIDTPTRENDLETMQEILQMIQNTNFEQQNGAPEQ